MKCAFGYDEKVAGCSQMLVLILLGLTSIGCEKGPPRYSVSGLVEYEGKVVPTGRLVFSPDHTAGNKGPQGVAVIEEGRIITNEDRKITGGPNWIQIMAFDGNPYEDGEGTVDYGRPLFPLAQAPVELPMADATLEIRIAKTSGEPKVEITVGEN